mmetsp:Transcript_2515/g.5477  ORF Transcript_2515/g.5477 Transcript_2515/m.5477 type:complete len:214 (+) Transcript_2515:126-767(+)
MMFSSKMSLSKMVSLSTRLRPATSSLSSSIPRPSSSRVAVASSSSSSSHIRSFSNVEQERPFKVLGIQQVAIGCEARDPLNKIWKDIFGLKEHTTMTLEKENVIEDIVKLGPAPYEVEIDLMCPFDVEKSPKVHVPPLNHIGLWIDDLEKAVEWMQSKGVRFTPGGIRKGAAGHNVTFIHPKGTKTDEAPIGGAGVLLELVQAPPEVIDAFTK